MRARDRIAVGLFVVGLAWGLVSPLHATMLGETKLVLPDPTGSDKLGCSVGISGGRAVVGASGNSVPVAGGGSAYVYNVGTGAQTYKLTAPDAAVQDAFGTSVGVSGNVAIVGAMGDDPGGSAYLYDVTNGTYLRKLTGGDTASGDVFGYSVAIYGNVAIVGAYGDDTSSGSAYLFNVTTGDQLHKLTADDAYPGDRFGYSVGISGNVAVIGAYLDDDPQSSAGSAYLFDVATGAQLRKLLASDGAGGDNFGYSVGIDGSVVIVGAYGNDDVMNNSGSAYLFDVATGAQLHKLVADDAEMMDEFGYSVAVSGNVAVVGARNDDDAGYNSGAAYLFNVTTGEQIDKMTPSDGAAMDSLGYSVAIAGYSGIVGAYLHDQPGADAGTAYLFLVPEPASLMLLVLGGLGVVVGRKRRA